ncbi:oxidoreductase [Roseicyclus persicicus]|uniref:Oxidoreductase n=1 Tax=Roseicyclus persicicus TaxID=2650661 RepID=A0A7X6JY99_9RHOB|nr:oxidoreductase [Roseibacterium persicicum]NKX43588.1 oxidoreductase [Roseibacterium persicicum]
MFTRQIVRSMVLGAALFAAGAAAALEPAEGEVLLTVTGAIAHTNADGAAQFDLALLEGFETVAIETTTIWTEGVQVFEGVELADLLAAVGAEGATLRAIALNDYAVDIPVADAVEGGPIIAFLRNGETMSLREKGPLWVIYPFDSNPEYQTEQIYARSIWQLDRIEVQP